MTLVILCNVNWLFPNSTTQKGVFLEGATYAQNQTYLYLSTTSNSKEWKPSNIETGGVELTWTASATGMIDQVVTTSSEPIFDLSVPRTSS